jgi:hypothetical protein
MIASFRESNCHGNADRRRPPDRDPGARAPIAHSLYDLNPYDVISPEKTAEKEKDGHPGCEPLFSPNRLSAVGAGARGRATMRRSNDSPQGLSRARFAGAVPQSMPASLPATLAAAYALPSLPRGRSRMRESRKYGSVRGAGSNARPYRDKDEYPRCAPSSAQPHFTHSTGGLLSLLRVGLENVETRKPRGTRSTIT